MNIHSEKLLGKVFHFRSPEALADAIFANNCPTDKKMSTDTLFKATGHAEVLGEIFLSLSRFKKAKEGGLQYIHRVPYTDLVNVFEHEANPTTRNEHLDLVQESTQWVGKNVRLRATPGQIEDPTVWKVTYAVGYDRPNVGYQLDLVSQPANGDVRELQSIDACLVEIVEESDLEDQLVDTLKGKSGAVYSNEALAEKDPVEDQPLNTSKFDALCEEIMRAAYPDELLADEEDDVISFEGDEPEDGDYSFFLQMTMQSPCMLEHLLRKVPGSDEVAAAKKIKSFVKELTTKE